MKARLFTFAAVLLLTAGAFAQGEKRTSIEYTPVTCIKAGELPLMQMNVEGEGVLRSYFRRVNSTDWCSVEGTNDGPLSRVVLPKFENGDEIEYFFVLIDGVRVVSRSPRIYRVRVANECEAAFARHMTRMTMNCGEEAQAIPSSLGAGYQVGDDIVAGNPPKVSPDAPGRRRRP